MTCPTLFACLALAAAPAAGDDEAPPPAPFVWDARAAEHLLNRAAFGASTDEIEAAVETGHEVFVDSLLAGPAATREPFLAERLSPRDRTGPPGMGMGTDRAEPMAGETMEDARRRAAQEARRADREQLFEFLGGWVGRMVRAEDPLRERMTLFWHGHFTSAYRDVRSSYEMIQQNELLRSLALGSFADLLREVARDPAMLEYLDNEDNRKGSPNENFARELLELFTLGEGQYGERDVKDVARAFTGWTERGGEFRFDRRRHDFGEKSVLGEAGRLDGDDVIDILLEHEACPRWIAGKLLHYFEGRAPDEARLAEYSSLLRDADYDVSAFLRHLFLDPAFYRDEVVGDRVSSPVDFLVGHCRRLGLEPPPVVIVLGSRMLGETLFDPPNVKGWEGGLTWITTSTFMNRGNLAGALLGLVDFRDMVVDSEIYDELLAEEAGDEEGAMAGPPRQAGGRDARALKLLQRLRWKPRFRLGSDLRQAGATSDAEVVDHLAAALLAVDLTDDTRAEVLGVLTDERAALGVEEGELPFAGKDGERLLRRTAHLLLSLPEAQLH